MRGKLVKTQGRVLYFLGLVDFLSAGWSISIYVKHHTWISLVAGVFILLAGVFAFIVYWYINHPKVPGWVEEAMGSDVKPLIKEVNNVREN